MKIEKCAIAIDNNNHELVSVIDNGGEFFAPSNIEVIEFDTIGEMNAYLDKHGLVLRLSGDCPVEC